MEEMMDDTLEGLDEDEELEEEADEEVEKVLFELTDGKLGQAGRVGGELPVSQVLSSYLSYMNKRFLAQATDDVEEEDEQDREMERMRQQLQAHLSG
jgi:hypothetical protein